MGYLYFRIFRAASQDFNQLVPPKEGGDYVSKNYSNSKR